MSIMDSSLDPSTSDVDLPSEASSSTPPLPLPATEDATPTKRDAFWFHDGSVILQVEQGLFRVHQTILANHSEVFAGLFEVPQPEGEDMLEGCPIVVLHDPEADFMQLLQAIYNPSYFDTLQPTADVDATLAFISPILRLSTKYLIKSLRHRCTHLLSSKFPTTFSDYTAKASTPHQERYKSDSMMRAISLAQETNVPTVLPYAYYCVARLSMKRLLKEREGDIGWRDKCLAMAGRERLRWAEMTLSHNFLLAFHRAPTCTSPICAHTPAPHHEWHLIEAANSPNPLRPYTKWHQLGLCKACVEYSQNVHDKGRREVWDKLPSFFGLPKWEVLSEMQGA